MKRSLHAMSIALFLTLTVATAKSMSTSSKSETPFPATEAHHHCAHPLKNDQLVNNVVAAVPLPFDKTVRVTVDHIHEARWFFTLGVPSPLSITFSSCSNYITRTLFYNRTIIIWNDTNPTLPTIAIPCAAGGRYDLLFFAAKPSPPCDLDIMVTLHNTNANWTLLDRVQPSRLRYQNRIKKKQMIIKWDKSKLDIHAIHYCISVSTESNQHTLCDAISNSMNLFTKKGQCSRLMDHFFVKTADKTLSIKPKAVTVACMGTKSRQILRNLRPNQQYFVDLFGVHTTQNNLSFPLRSTSIWFNRSEPLVIADGGVVTAKLSEFGRQLVFSFRVPRKWPSKSVQIQVLPCGATLTVKVFKAKLLQTTVHMHKPTTIGLSSGALPGDKFIIKVAAANDHESRPTHKIAVSATTERAFPLLPNLPNNTLVYELTARNTCNTAWIAWHSVKDSRNIRYCVILVKVDNLSAFHVASSSSSVCESSAQLTNHPNFRQMHCFRPTEPIKQSSKEMQSFELTHLTASSFFSVHVMVQLNGISLPYDVLRISTNPACYEFDDDKNQIPESDAIPPNLINVSSVSIN